MEIVGVGKVINQKVCVYAHACVYSHACVCVHTYAHALALLLSICQHSTG